MPKNKFQDVIYTIIMASVMVYGMVAYNIVLNTGSMQNWVFLAVFHEWPIMTVIAILLELVFVGKLAMKVAFRLVNPREANQTSIMLAISAASVWLMCPCMSFFATLLFKDSHNAQFFAIWVQTTVMNFPMALLVRWYAAFSVCCSGRTQTNPLRRRWSRFNLQSKILICRFTRHRFCGAHELR